MMQWARELQHNIKLSIAVACVTNYIITNWCILNYKSSTSTTSTHIFDTWMLVYVLERMNMKDDLYLGLNRTNE